MRTAFIRELAELAALDERIWLVCADLGYSVLELFADRFPQRYLNVGVAEQNMTGIAAGLALSGKTVFTYSIANFPVIRCLEQIRNDVCYHNLNVKVVAVGGGLAYGSNGYTHHAVEDFAVTASLPNIVVAAPGDPTETRAVTRALARTPGPAYLRLGKAGEPVLYPSTFELNIGESIKVREGSDLTLLSTGAMLATTLAAAERLLDLGITTQVLSFPFIVPLDQAAVLAAAAKTQALITVEEHGYGGLGTMVGEVLACAGMPVRFYPVRLGKKPVTIAGSQEYLRSLHGLTTEAIVARARTLCCESMAYNGHEKDARES
jgi:transketolase